MISSNETKEVVKVPEGGLDLFKFRMGLGLSYSDFAHRFGGFSAHEVQSFENDRAEIPFRLFTDVRKSGFTELTPPLQKDLWRGGCGRP